MPRLRSLDKDTTVWKYRGDELVSITDKETGLVRDVQVAEIYDPAVTAMYWVKGQLDHIRKWAEQSGKRILRLSMWSHELANAPSRCRFVPELEMDAENLSRFLRRRSLPWPSYRGTDPLVEEE